jgi:ferredoxin
MLSLRVEVTFVRHSGERIKAKGKIGDSLLDVVVNNNIDLDGFGACEGTLTCSTCHLIFTKPDFEKLPDTPSDEEMDMLDLAYDLQDTSRLGCQIYLSKDMNGLEVKVSRFLNFLFSLSLTNQSEFLMCCQSGASHG